MKKRLIALLLATAILLSTAPAAAGQWRQQRPEPRQGTGLHHRFLTKQGVRAL